MNAIVEIINAMGGAFVGSPSAEGSAGSAGRTEAVR